MAYTLEIKLKGFMIRSMKSYVFNGPPRPTFHLFLVSSNTILQQTIWKLTIPVSIWCWDSNLLTKKSSPIISGNNDYRPFEIKVMTKKWLKEEHKLNKLPFVEPEQLMKPFVRIWTSSELSYADFESFWYRQNYFQQFREWPLLKNITNAEFVIICWNLLFVIIL